MEKHGAKFVRRKGCWIAHIPIISPMLGTPNAPGRMLAFAAYLNPLRTRRKPAASTYEWMVVWWDGKGWFTVEESDPVDVKFWAYLPDPPEVK